jgi:hypothetical protein
MVHFFADLGVATQTRAFRPATAGTLPAGRGCPVLHLASLLPGAAPGAPLSYCDDCALNSPLMLIPESACSR